MKQKHSDFSLSGDKLEFSKKQKSHQSITRVWLCSSAHNQYFDQKHWIVPNWYTQAYLRWFSFLWTKDVLHKRRPEFKCNLLVLPSLSEVAYLPFLPSLYLPFLIPLTFSFFSSNESKLISIFQFISGVGTRMFDGNGAFSPTIIVKILYTRINRYLEHSTYNCYVFG